MRLEAAAIEVPRRCALTERKTPMRTLDGGFTYPPPPVCSWTGEAAAAQ